MHKLTTQQLRSLPFNVELDYIEFIDTSSGSSKYWGHDECMVCFTEDYKIQIIGFDDSVLQDNINLNTISNVKFSIKKF